MCVFDKLIQEVRPELGLGGWGGVSQMKVKAEGRQGLYRGCSRLRLQFLQRHGEMSEHSALGKFVDWLCW